MISNSLLVHFSTSSQNTLKTPQKMIQNTDFVSFSDLGGQKRGGNGDLETSNEKQIWRSGWKKIGKKWNFVPGRGFISGR